MIASSIAIAQVPPPFSAVAHITTESNDYSQTRQFSDVMLFFDGKDKWRLDPNRVPQRSTARLDTPFGLIRPIVTTDVFIRDQGRHVLYRFLSRPLTTEVFYHEFDVGVTSPKVVEAAGLDDWTIYDTTNPCAGSPTTECRKKGSAKVRGSPCTVWILTWEDQAHRTKSKRTIWLDNQTGITLRSELSEVRLRELGKGASKYKVTTELNDVRIGEQDPSLFELIGKGGLRILQDSRPDPTSPYVFRTLAKEVLTDAAVRDKRGYLVTGLTKQDFHVFEDGSERALAGFWFDEHPIAVALVVDSSSSMQSSIRELQSTSVEVLSRLKAEDQVALIVFEEFVNKLVELTTDRQAIANALGEVKAAGGTDVVNALFIATLYLRKNAPDRRRVIILISDNLAPSVTFTRIGSLRSETELIDTALQNETAIYSLRVDSGGGKWPGIVSMEEVTRSTGGMMMNASQARKMLDEVVSELRKRYVLSFIPGRSQPDGRLHTIEVTLSERFGVSEKDYTVHHRTGYRTPQVERTTP
jgi:VWFA-related protein